MTQFKESAYPVVETIRARRSVRTYSNQHLSSEIIDKIQSYIDGASNPFGADVRVSIVQKSIDGKGEKLGTYGIIKGADTFLGLSVAPGHLALLAAGYQFEDIILYITSLGLGTVWLAATFTRSKFQAAMNIPDDFLFPAISPVGYPAEKRFFEKIMRKAIGANTRKPWSELFFDGDFDTSLTAENAGVYATALEMLRLAPSATNAQPWRVLKCGDTFHFFETHKANASDDDVKIKQVDLGIATLHFQKTIMDQGIDGIFAGRCPTQLTVPQNYHYVISWIRKTV